MYGLDIPNADQEIQKQISSKKQKEITNPLIDKGSLANATLS